MKSTIDESLKGIVKSNYLGYVSSGYEDKDILKDWVSQCLADYALSGDASGFIGSTQVDLEQNNQEQVMSAIIGNYIDEIKIKSEKEVKGPFEKLVKEKLDNGDPIKVGDEIRDFLVSGSHEGFTETESDELDKITAKSVMKSLATRYVHSAIDYETEDKKVENTSRDTFGSADLALVSGSIKELDITLIMPEMEALKSGVIPRENQDVERE